MTQLFIAIFSLTAICFALGEHPGRRKLAPIIGLAGQPFWFIATISAQQWGMVALCGAYSAVYARAIWINWRPGP